MALKIAPYFPILEWGKTYRMDTLASDLVAAVIVTIMLIPQSLAYALLDWIIKRGIVKGHLPLNSV